MVELYCYQIYLAPRMTLIQIKNVNQIEIVKALLYWKENL